jgi:uncharacterized UPF0160 family protein
LRAAAVLLPRFTSRKRVRSPSSPRSRAAELVFDVGGGSITNRDLGFDRHRRTARTAANHTPRQWKQAVAGAYHLTGEEPPTTGLF